MDIKELKNRAKKKRLEKTSFDKYYSRIAKELYLILDDIFCYYGHRGELKIIGPNASNVATIGDYEIVRQIEPTWISYAITYINSGTRIIVNDKRITGTETFARDFHDYLLKYEYTA